MESIPVKWAPVIAAAWLDEKFKNILKNDPVAAFREFGLTYQGKVPFDVPAAPPKQDISILREKAKQEVIVHTCTHSLYINLTETPMDLDYTVVISKDNKDRSSFYAISEDVNELNIYNNGELVKTIRRS